MVRGGRPARPGRRRRLSAVAERDPRERVDVVRVIARLNVGGPALHTMNLSEGLDGRYRTLLVTGEVGPDEADMSDQAELRGIRLVRIPELGREPNPLNDLRALWKLARLLRRVRPRIVHTHTAKAGTLGRLAALAARVPVRVHTFHGHVFHGYFSARATRVYLAIERALARVTTRVVAISDAQADDLSDRYRVCGRDRLSVIPLGLDLARFRPDDDAEARASFRRELGVGDGEPVVVIVGRLVPIKNHDLFLDLAARFAAAGRPGRFVVVGGGEEEGRLRARARELGVEGRVTFLGWRSDLERVYAGADVVVLTSHNEGTPVCLIEALAAGRAVASTDVGGVRDVLEHGRLGVLVPPGDVEGLDAAVAALLDDPARRAELGRLGARSAPGRYGVGRLLNDVAALYEELDPAGRRGGAF